MTRHSLQPPMHGFRASDRISHDAGPKQHLHMGSEIPNVISNTTCRLTLFHHILHMVPNMRAQLQPHFTYKWVHSLVNVESTAHHDKASKHRQLRPLSQLDAFPQGLCMFPVSAIRVSVAKRRQQPGHPLQAGPGKVARAMCCYHGTAIMMER